MMPLTSPELEQNDRPLHAVGEVIHNEFTIKEVSKHGSGRDEYLCTRSSDPAVLLVECVSLAHTIPPNRPDMFHALKQALLEARNAEESPIRDSFELHVWGDTRFYVVRDAARQIEGIDSTDATDAHALENYMEPQLRPCPEGGLCVVYRMGECRLEVDIPAVGFDSSFTFVLAIGAVFVFSMGIPCILPGASLDIPALIIVGVFLSGVSALGWTYFMISLYFVHTNLVIAPDYFRQKSCLELYPRFRDSVNHPNEADGMPTALETIFCKQLEGTTALLQEAEIQVYKDSDGNETKQFVLKESTGRQYVLKSSLLESQQEWLVSEINAVLANIRNRTENVPETSV